MNREDLISLCERGIVNKDSWGNRDSASAHRQLGECWALLKANCDFRLLSEGHLVTDEYTIWIEITYPGFAYCEGGAMEKRTFYLPTDLRLERGGDWY